MKMKRRNVWRIGAVALAIALTGCAGQAEPEDRSVWMNAAQSQYTTEETQDTAPTISTAPRKRAEPENVPTEAPTLQQEAAEVTVPITAATEPQILETSPPQTSPPETQPPQTQPPATKPSQQETVPPTTVPPETNPPQTEPPSGDIYSASEAMAGGNSYAASAYGMTVSPELGYGNASYEFADTAYVSGLKRLGGQSYLNQMVIAKVDSLAANLLGAYGEDTALAGIRVNCHVEYDPDGELYWIYVFYG